MFSKTIIESDIFLDMSLSTQALYFHLGMQADDDGFVSPHRIMRMIGAQPDDLKILVAKQLIIPFENGVVVVRHWKVNNYLQVDRKKDTIYLKELSSLNEDDNNVYNKDTKCIQNVHVGKDSIGKDSIYSVQFEDFWKLYDLKVGRRKCEKKWCKIRASERDAIMAYLPKYKASTDDKQFRKHPFTFLNQRGWEDEIVASQSKSGKEIELHDGEKAIFFHGTWVDARDKNVKINPKYYPEIKNL